MAQKSQFLQNLFIELGDRFSVQHAHEVSSFIPQRQQKERLPRQAMLTQTLFGFHMKLKNTDDQAMWGSTMCPINL